MNDPEGHAGHGDHTMPSHSGAPMDHGSMAMVWNWTYDTVIVFNFWRTSGPGGLFLSCVAIFLLSVLFELFRSYRTKQDRRLLQIMETGGHDRYDEEEGLLGNETIRGQRGHADDGGDSDSEGLGNARQTFRMRHGFGRRDTSIVSHGRNYYQFIRSLFHAVEVFFGFFLMMVFMTLNGYLCLSLVAGAGVGFFLYQRSAVPAMKSALSCH